jgi:hypothetical protein
VVTAGVGEKNKKAKFFVSTFNNPNSTFATDFMKKSRYAYRKWDRTIEVQVVTLDLLIKKFGVPKFCKIDVEGYEWEVIRGLKQPIKALSFEFLSEFNNKTEMIVERLERLGMTKFNYCVGLEYKFRLKSWTNGKELMKVLRNNAYNRWGGDVYAIDK